MASATELGVVSVLEVVNTLYGLEGSERGTEYDMLCPNPNHFETHPSCSINMMSGYWNCFSCGVGGDLVELGVIVLGKPYDAVKGMLSSDSPDTKLAILQRRLANLSYMPPRRRRTIELPTYEPIDSHPELSRRHITPETIERWRVCWCPEQELEGNKGTFTIRNSIAIPIMDPTGENLAWCYRATETSPKWQPKYLYTPEVEISELWFGRFHHETERRVSIVEGALDTMWLDQCGFPALGLLGSKMGDRKILWLQRYHSAWLLPDYDTAGARWQDRVIGMIGQRMPLRLCQYRDWMLKKRPERDGTYRRATDPEELRRVDLEIMHATAPLVTVNRLAKHHAS